MNLFATVLTYPAPSANYRGESEENRSVIQKVTSGRFEYPIISPEAMRNALREILAAYGLPSNRERLHTEAQLAVRFADYPDPARFADDFLFGYFVADRTQIPKKVRTQRGFQFKRDSILRMNLAKGLEPYRQDAVFTQSPLTVKNTKRPWQNARTSALLHRETAVTAFQYPFAINLDDCRLADAGKPGGKAPDGTAYASAGEQHKDWLHYLLRAIAELSGVAGNHARSYFEMAPASVAIRLTDSAVAGYDTYGFTSEGTFPDLLDGILHDDFPGQEFSLGGRIVKSVLEDSVRDQLQAKGVRLFRMANQALNAIATRVCGRGFLGAGEDKKGGA